MIFYKLHCDGAGCLREIDSAFGAGIQMPQGWSEFKGQVTISNGPFAPPTQREIVKHYCWDCRDRMREHGVAPSETVVMGPDRLPSGEPPSKNRCGGCGFVWPARSRYAACPKCGRVKEYSTDAE